MSFARAMHQNGERGSITVFFVLFVLVASAAVSYALYVGRTAEEKMRTDTAADLAALAMAQHASMGLNMVSVNNLAVGGNLHVGAAIPYIGRYYAILTAFNVDLQTNQDGKNTASEYFQMLAGGETADKTIYGKGFDKTKSLTARFVKTAAGLTTINVMIAKHWLRGGLVKGVEQLRMNKPGDVGLMFQASTAANAGDALKFFDMKFKNLALATPKETMCQTIKASMGISGERNTVSYWLGGVVASVAGAGGIVNALATVEGAITSVSGQVGAEIDKGVDKMKDEVRLITGGLNCDDDWDQLEYATQKKARKICNQIEEMDGLSRPGGLMPNFAGCGITRSGDFAEQFEKFTSAQASEKHAIGFVFPNVQGGNLEPYEDSLQFAAMVGNPVYLLGEVPKKVQDGVKSTTCPAEWKVEVNGHTYCSLMLDGIDFEQAGTGSEPSDKDVAAGGVASATGGSGAQKGALAGIWSRVQWSLGQAKAEYEPGEGDPTSASLGAQDVGDKNLRANKRRMQFFWPAWRGRHAEPTVMGAVLKMLGTH